MHQPARGWLSTARVAHVGAINLFGTCLDAVCRQLGIDTVSCLSRSHIVS